jgi:phosphate transport system protein
MSEHEFKIIRQKLLRIGELAKNAVNVSMDALRKRDASLCNRVNHVEKETDFLNVDVEDTCLEILSSHKLQSKAFRFVATAMNISSRFERVADHAVEIAEHCRRGLPKSLIPPSVYILKMGEVANAMIDINLEAISKDSMIPIEDLERKQREIIDLYETVYGSFVSFIHENPEAFDDAMLLVKVALDLRRIGELAVKIGNRVVYIMEGRRTWIGQ